MASLILWQITLAGCHVFEDLSAQCFTFVWGVPW